MRNSRYFKIILSAVLLAFALQAGLMAYSMINNKDYNDRYTKKQSLVDQIKSFAVKTTQDIKTIVLADISPTDTSPAAITADSTVTYPTGAAISAAEDAAEITGITGITEITIPDDVLELIRQSDPAGYDRNIANYKEFLSKLNIHKNYQKEIEDMMRNGSKLPYIMIAYSYVNDKYGRLEDVKALVDARASGKEWLSIFDEYNKNNPEFVPQSFDPAYLEELSNMEGITKDDIMIADRVSQKLKAPFKEVIQKRIGGTTWRDINAGYGIVNGQEELPYVPVTQEQIKKLIQSSGLTEQSILQAFVIAYKFDSTAEAIIGEMKSGYSKTRIYAGCLENMYE